MIVCWGEGHGSAIHDHADSHCFMKMLQGELREIRYEWPSVTNEKIDSCPTADINYEPESSGDYNSDELQELSRGSMDLNSVRYINGEFSTRTNYKYHLFILCILAKIPSRRIQLYFNFVVLKTKFILSFKFVYFK